MKKVMKTLALALALCMLMSVAAFASSATLTSSDYVINVTVDGAGTADEVALLVTKAGADMAALADSDILYINQMPATAGTAAFGDITIAQVSGVDAVAVYVGSETLSTSGYVTLDSNLKLTNAVTTITVNLSGDVVKVNGIEGKDAVKKGANFGKLSSLEVRESIGRFKYIEEERIDQSFEALMGEMKAAISDLVSKEAEDDD